MKQLKVIIISIMSMLMTMSYAKAQEETVTNEPHNIIKLNCGAGMLFSEINNYKEQKVKHTSSTLDLTLNYVRLYDNKYGYIFDFTNSQISGSQKNEFFIGLGIYGIKPNNNGWYYDGNLCIGYMRKDFGLSNHGIGLKGQLGGGYKLSRHFGIGANLSALAGLYINKAENDYYFSSHLPTGTDENQKPIRLTLSIGMQYFF